jgi:integrase
MTRVRNVLPSYLLHKSSGQARCRIDGKDHLLGVYGSEESRIRYGELVARFAGGLKIDPSAGKKSAAPDCGPSVAELMLAFMKHAEGYYLKPDGTHTDEIHCLRSALKPLREIYGFTPIRDFSPLMFKAVREAFVAKGWCRGYINRSTNRVRGMFKWGVSCGMVPVDVWQALTAVTPLKAGRCEAHDNKRREAVSEEHLQAVRERLRQKNRDIFDLLLLTASRVGELLSITWEQIDTKGDVWSANLEHHKNAYRGKSRKLFFGKQAQEILARYKNVPASERIFSTRRDVFSQILKLACGRAGVPSFVPHQLRHTAGTRIRDAFGVERAQAHLGHSSPDMTAVYTANTDKLARDTAAQVG